MSPSAFRAYLTGCLICFMAWGLKAETSLRLENLPWTDAAYCWSPHGPRLPQLNTNYSGNGPITIGGQTFHRGISGHTGFSIVYHLDQTATQFSAWIGVDQEHDPQDPIPPVANVKFVVLTDQCVVFRELIDIGAAPRHIAVDLKGKSQLELRGEYGTQDFRNQRLAWANPLIHTECPEKLLTVLRQNRERHQAHLKHTPTYPPPPDWKHITVRKIDWQGCSHAYLVDNGRYECVIAPECGGRILVFKPQGGNSLLKSQVMRGTWATTRGHCKDLAGGHFMRIQPAKNFHPNDPLLLHGKFNLDFPSEGHILMTSQTSALYRVTYQYHLTILPDSPQLCIAGTITNQAPFTQPLGLWSITRLDPLNLRRFLLPLDCTHPNADMTVSQRGRAVTVSRQGENLEARTDVRKNTPQDFWEMKAWNPTRAVTAEDKTGSRLTIAYHAKTPQMTQQPATHLYVCDRFAEVETHTPIHQLKPGQSITLNETWNATPPQPSNTQMGKP